MWRWRIVLRCVQSHSVLPSRVPIPCYRQLDLRHRPLARRARFPFVDDQGSRRSLCPAHVVVPIRCQSLAEHLSRPQAVGPGYDDVNKFLARPATSARGPPERGRPYYQLARDETIITASSRRPRPLPISSLGARARRPRSAAAPGRDAWDAGNPASRTRCRSSRSAARHAGHRESF